MNGPGDRAPKHCSLKEPMPSFWAEGHVSPLTNAEQVDAILPGSKNSARHEMSCAQESGDLSGASESNRDSRHTWEGHKPQSRVVAAEESDEVIVPKKPVKTRVTPVELVEGRAEAKGKFAVRNALPTQGGASALTQVQQIGMRAKMDQEVKFTNLLCHVKVPLLREAYQRLSKKAAAGVDGVTWQEYGERLEERLADLQERIHRGSYHPHPTRRVYIPKPDGTSRPLGIAALEDKIVQQAVRMVLEPIYEKQFLGFSYGFRPGRSQHQALDALAVAIARKVNYVLDADIRSFFDTIDHRWMQKFIEHKIGDRRLVRLLMKWLKAGVMEDDELREVQEGVPQGGGISPLLANVYLHYAFDLWAQRWRKKEAKGELYIIRFADDVVMGFEKEKDAQAMREALANRLAKFGLELHPDKTRVLRFGRFARRTVEPQRQKPQTFDFLGFTHISGVDRAGRFQLQRRTSCRKRRVKLASLKEEMRIRRHTSMAEQHKWLTSVLTGHYRYYGVPTNHRLLQAVKRKVEQMWYRSLQRRSQRAKWNATRYATISELFPLPVPKIYHPWPSIRFSLR